MYTRDNDAAVLPNNGMCPPSYISNECMSHVSRTILWQMHDSSWIISERKWTVFGKDVCDSVTVNPLKLSDAERW